MSMSSKKRLNKGVKIPYNSTPISPRKPRNPLNVLQQNDEQLFHISRYNMSSKEG